MLRELRKGGYDPEYIRVDTMGAMQQALEEEWDIVIADHSMPFFSSTAALDLLKRSRLDIPFILVSGAIGEEIAVEAMRKGAHDYIMKGNLMRLVPAIKRELREAEVRRERKATQEELRRSEARNRALVGAIPDTMFRIDHLGRYIDFVHAKSKALFDGDSVIGKKVTEVFPEEVAQQTMHAIERTLASGESQIIEYSLFAPTDAETAERHYELRLVVCGEDEVLAIMRDISKRKHAEQQIHDSLHEKEVLLKEIHHRVKNNLQIISSLLSLQSRYITEPHYGEMFTDSQNRIQSMALIHEKLYQSADLRKIDFCDYIRHLANTLFGTYQASRKDIRFELEVEDVALGIDDAIPCGLVINELLSNALKYAFPDDRSGTISVRLRRLDEVACDRTIELVIADDGVGLPADVDVQHSDSLGLRLVKILAEDQLGGTIEVRRDEGTAFRIAFSTRHTGSTLTA